MGDSEIEAFLAAIEYAFSGVDRSLFWPANGEQIGLYFDDYAALDLYKELDVLRRLSRKQLFEVLAAPAILKSGLVNYSFIGMKRACKQRRNITQKDVMKFAKDVFVALKQMCAGDVFCKDGCNIVLSQPELRALLSPVTLEKATVDSRKKVGSLITASNAAMWALYFDIFSQACMSVHGPYTLSPWTTPNSVLLIRDFFDFSPDFWPATSLSCKKLRILTIYSGADIKIDFLSHIRTKSSLTDKLTHFCIIADDRYILNLKDIVSLTTELSDLRKRQVSKVNSLSPQEIIHKSAEVCYYPFKIVRRKYFNEGWRPPAAIKQRIKRYGLANWNKYKQVDQPELAYYRWLFDPRNEFY